MNEYGAALSYANAWNTYNPNDFLKLVSDDVVFNSQMWVEAIVGKKPLSEYLKGKMEAIKNSTYQVSAYVGKTTKSFPEERDCTILFHSTEKTPSAIVLFEISNNNLVTQIDLCIPELYAPVIA